MLFRGMDGQTRENVRKIMGFPSKDNPKIFRDAFKVHLVIIYVLSYILCIDFGL